MQQRVELDRIESEAFAWASDLVAASRTSPQAVYAALDRCVRAVAPSADALTVWRAEGDRFVCAYASGLRYERFTGAVLPAADPRSPLVAARMRDAHCLTGGPLLRLHPGDLAGLAAPLDRRETVLYAALREPPARPACSRIAARARMAGTALRLALDREADRAAAIYDGLTGLLSPRAFRLELNARLEALARTSCSPRASLLFIDTDRFKAWNDGYGHAAGDELLCALAAQLREHAGPRDLVARNGGDEFCLVWFDCEKSTAIARAEALRVAIETLDYASLRPRGADQTIAITASIGIAAYPVDADTAESLLESADEAMYASKHSGRNRVSYRDTAGVLRQIG